MIATELREAHLQISEAIAPGWERQRAFVEEVSAAVREWMLRSLAPSRGQTLLELAAGAGDTGLDAAAEIGPEGRLICTDVSPRMVALARRRAAARGAANVEHRVMDAEAIDLPDGSVDGALCRYGYMLALDPGRALAETGRVLRDGGRLALAVWGAPQDNSFFTVVVGALVAEGHMAPPDPEGPGVFRLADPSRLRGLMHDAGLGSIDLEEVPVRFAVDGVEHYLSVIQDTAGPIGLTLQRLDEQERAAVHERVDAALAPFRSDEGLVLPGIALAASAVR